MHPYSGHLGGAIQASDNTDGHEAGKGGHDELVTTLPEVDGGVVGSLWRH